MLGMMCSIAVFHKYSACIVYILSAFCNKKNKQFLLDNLSLVSEPLQSCWHVNWSGIRANDLGANELSF